MEEERKKKDSKGPHNWFCRLLVFGIMISCGFLFVVSNHSILRSGRYAVTGTDHQQNTWYQFANQTAIIYNRTNCYVCAFVPHSACQNPYVTPSPLGLIETMCLIGWFSTDRMTHRKASHWLPNCTEHARPNMSDWRLPANYSGKTNETNEAGVVLYRWPDQPPFCFQRTCTHHTDFRDSVSLGDSRCNETLIIPNRFQKLTHRLCNMSRHCENQFGMMQLNWTEVGRGLVDWNLPLSENNRTGMMTTEVPDAAGYGCPTDMVWFCGPRVYLYLPSGWCGTCYMARLGPTAVVIPEHSVTNHKNEQGHIRAHKKRDISGFSTPYKKGQVQHITGVQGLFMFLILPYSAIIAEDQLNQLWWTLEELTEAVLMLTKQIEDDSEIRAMRSMVLQNRAALDFLLAEQGGVCTLIGDHCCTYIPEGYANYSLIEEKLSLIKTKIEAGNSPEAGMGDWNPLHWFTSGTWSSVLLKVCTPILVVLLLCCVFFMCIIPCLRVLISKWIGNMIGQAPGGTTMMPLLEPGPESDGEEDDPAEDKYVQLKVIS